MHYHHTTCIFDQIWRDYSCQWTDLHVVQEWGAVNYESFPALLIASRRVARFSLNAPRRVVLVALVKAEGLLAAALGLI